METSCLKNKNVASAFETLIEITNIEAKKNPKGFQIKDDNQKVKKKCICPLFN